MTILATPPSKSTDSSTMDSLYAQNPGTVKATAANADASQATAAQAGGTLAQAKNASATGYDAFTQNVPEADLSSSQLNKITSQDSPLMKRARQEGMLTAAKRGLQNSSIAAGAAQGEMVDRATPLAQTNAQQLSQQSLANQAATNQAREVSTGRETDVSALNAQLETNTSQFNAGQQNEIAKLNAQMQTAVSQGNAELATQIAARMAELQTQVNLENTQAENQMRSQVLAANVELNKQYLANTGALDLATIEGTYNQLISSNQTAANLYNSYFQSISEAMANKDIPPDRIAQYVQIQQSMLESGLRMMDQMNGLDLGNFQLPGVVVSGSGQGAALTPVQPGEAPGTTPINQGTITVGNAQLPAGTTWQQVSGTPGGKGVYNIFDANGTQIGTLVPGGKNGIYRPIGSPQSRGG